MPLASFFSRADWFESYLVENPEDRFSRDEAQSNPGLYYLLLSWSFECITLWYNQTVQI